MKENVHGQDEFKDGHVSYRHGLELKPLRSEGLCVEKQWIRLSISEVDVMASMSENGSNRRLDLSGGVIGATGVVGVVLGTGEDDKKG